MKLNSAACRAARDEAARSVASLRNLPVQAGDATFVLVLTNVCEIIPQPDPEQEGESK